MLLVSSFDLNAQLPKNEYEIYKKGTFSLEWTVINDSESNKYLKFPLIGPSLLLDSNKNKVGKVSIHNIFTRKKFIKFNENQTQIKAYIKSRLCKYIISGETNIKGFEQIYWSCKIDWKHSKIILKALNDDNRVIAEFERYSRRFKEIGKLYIFEDFPPDLNSFIVYTVCYCIRRVKKREESGAIRGGGGAAAAT